MVNVGSLIVGVVCLIVAIISAVVYKRYILAAGSALTASACIFNAIRV